MTGRAFLLVAGFLLVPVLCFSAAHRPIVTEEGIKFTLQAVDARDVLYRR